jgi:L-ribulose-5-phosphate 3-epimerase
MLKDVSIGIMQGRLSDKPGQELQSFPYGQWHEEFERASETKYDLVEWLVDTYDNPIITLEGRAESMALSAKYKVGIQSLCAHVFMNGDLFSEGENSVFAKNYLSELLLFSEEVGIKFVILPVMDKMSLQTKNAKNILNSILSEVLISSKVMLLLESDLVGNELRKFVEDVNSTQLGVLYDLGNATALGFDIEDDLSTLGSLVREIHVKDRMLNNGTSKRLGSGDTPFENIAVILNKLSWHGPVVLETPIYNDWKSEAVHNLYFTRKWINKV